MSDENAIRYRGEKTITFLGERGGDPLLFRFKRRKNEESAIFEGGMELGPQVHASDASRRHPDNRLPTPHQYAEALLFHWRMEPAGQDSSLVSPGSHNVEAL